MVIAFETVLDSALRQVSLHASRSQARKLHFHDQGGLLRIPCSCAKTREPCPYSQSSHREEAIEKSTLKLIDFGLAREFAPDQAVRERETERERNLREREKLLAALCMVFQEMVEGNADRHTVSAPVDSRLGKKMGARRRQRPTHLAAPIGQLTSPPYGDYRCNGSLGIHGCC